MFWKDVVARHVLNTGGGVSWFGNSPRESGLGLECFKMHNVSCWSQSGVLEQPFLQAKLLPKHRSNSIVRCYTENK